MSFVAVVAVVLLFVAIACLRAYDAGYRAASRRARQIAELAMRGDTVSVPTGTCPPQDFVPGDEWVE